MHQGRPSVAPGGFVIYSTWCSIGSFSIFTGRSDGIRPKKLVDTSALYSLSSNTIYFFDNRSSIC